MKKNYWPHAIIGILIFGVLMISISITIALKHPVQEENTYFSTKRVVDENINDIIRQQTRFDKDFTFFVSFLDDYAVGFIDGFVFPYLAKPNKKDDKPKQIPNNIFLTFALKPQTQSSLNIVSIKLFVDSYTQANMLKEIALLNKVDNVWNPVDNAYLAIESTFCAENVKLPLGRWKMIFEITYKDKDKEGKAFYETQVNIIDKAEHSMSPQNIS